MSIDGLEGKLLFELCEIVKIFGFKCVELFKKNELVDVIKNMLEVELVEKKFVRGVKIKVKVELLGDLFVVGVEVEIVIEVVLFFVDNFFK